MWVKARASVTTIWRQALYLFCFSRCLLCLAESRKSINNYWKKILYQTELVWVLVLLFISCIILDLSLSFLIPKTGTIKGPMTLNCYEGQWEIPRKALSTVPGTEYWMAFSCFYYYPVFTHMPPFNEFDSERLTHLLYLTKDISSISFTT